MWCVCVSFPDSHYHPWAGNSEISARLICLCEANDTCWLENEEEEESLGYNLVLMDSWPHVNANWCNWIVPTWRMTTEMVFWRTAVGQWIHLCFQCLPFIRMSFCDWQTQRTRQIAIITCSAVASDMISFRWCLSELFFLFASTSSWSLKFLFQSQTQSYESSSSSSSSLTLIIDSGHRVGGRGHLKTLFCGNILTVRVTAASVMLLLPLLWEKDCRLPYVNRRLKEHCFNCLLIRETWPFSARVYSHYRRLASLRLLITD